MKKSLIMAVAAILALGGLGIAGTVPPKSSPQPKPVAAQEMSFQGTVVAVDQHARTFTVRSDDKSKTEMAFHVGDTKIMINGEQRLFNEIQRGEMVTVTYTTALGKHTATHVRTHKK